MSAPGNFVAPAIEYNRATILAPKWFRPHGEIERRTRRKGGERVLIQSAALAFDKPIDRLWSSDHFGVVVDLEISAGG
jgi:hypothetical protein